jgi:crossover junction endodeoxyribonuclease RuvC
MTPRVYGLDLSLTATGIASSLGWCDAIGRDGVTTLPLTQRDEAIYELAQRITSTINPAADLVVIEAPAYSRSSGGAHERAGLWWRVVHRLHSCQIPVVEVPPNLRSIYATGKSQAKKTEVVDAVARRWPTWQTGGDDNRADAVTLMALGLDHLGAPLCPMPAKNRTALERVAWPEMAVAS